MDCCRVQGRLVVLPRCGCKIARYYNSSFVVEYLHAYGFDDLGSCETAYGKAVDSTVATLLDVTIWNLCATLQSENIPDTCYSECVSTCHQSIYNPSLTQSGPWPHRAELKQIYAKYINGTSIEDDFKGVSSGLPISYNTINIGRFAVLHL